jgi:hypothetical protein
LYALGVFLVGALGQRLPEVEEVVVDPQAGRGLKGVPGPGKKKRDPCEQGAKLGPLG